MTNVVDRPTTDTRLPELPDIEIPVSHQPLRPQMFRWLGWLLLAGAIAAVAFFAIDANSENVVETPPVAFELPASAITADPKVRTPLGGGAVVPEIVEDATVSPLVYTRNRPIGQLETTFPDESTVSPWIYGP